MPFVVEWLGDLGVVEIRSIDAKNLADAIAAAHDLSSDVLEKLGELRPTAFRIKDYDDREIGVFGFRR